MKTCPSCKKESASDTECTNCGIYFAKWEKLHGGGQSASAPAEAQPSSPASSSSGAAAAERRSGAPWLLIAVLALAGAVLFYLRGSSEKEIRRTYSAFHEAIASGELSRIKAVVSSRYAGEFNEAGADIKLKMVQAFQPAEVKITEIRVTGSEAVVRSRGVKDGTPAAGVTMMVKEGDGWKVSREEWDFGMTAAAAPAAPETSVPEPGASFPAPVAAEAGPASDSGGDRESRPYAGRDVSGNSEKRPIPELLSALKTEAFYKDKIFDELISRGERTRTVDTLNEMLRDKSGGRAETAAAKRLLKKAGAPVTFDWDHNSWERPPEDKYSLMGWEIEMRGDSIMTAGKLYIGSEIADGFTRPQKNEFKAPTYARYEFTVEGPGLARPAVKVVDASLRAGEQPWDGLTLASGLVPGEYKVSLYLNAQTVQADGTPLSLNHNSAPLRVEKD